MVGVFEGPVCDDDDDDRFSFSSVNLAFCLLIIICTNSCCCYLYVYPKASLLYNIYMPKSELASIKALTAENVPLPTHKNPRPTMA